MRVLEWHSRECCLQLFSFLVELVGLLSMPSLCLWLEMQTWAMSIRRGTTRLAPTGGKLVPVSLHLLLSLFYLLCSLCSLSLHPPPPPPRHAVNPLCFSISIYSPLLCLSIASVVCALFLFALEPIWLYNWASCFMMQRNPVPLSLALSLSLCLFLPHAHTHTFSFSCPLSLTLSVLLSIHQALRFQLQPK